jgi:uncharacterized protein YjcR
LIQKIRELDYFNEKDFKKILDEKKEALSQVKGIAFVISLLKEVSKEKKEIIELKALKEFSLRELFLPFLKTETRGLKSFSFSEIFLPFKRNFLTLLKNPKFLLILVFLLLLALGHFLFH